MLWRRQTGKTRKTARVLYVEDSAFMQMAVPALFKPDEPIEFRIAGSGLEALDELPRFRPDLILMDVMMPGLDGTHSMRIIRSAPEYSSIPVIFLTGKAALEDLRRYRRLGVDAVVAKPFDPERLRALILDYCALPASRSA